MWAFITQISTLVAGSREILKLATRLIEMGKKIQSDKKAKEVFDLFEKAFESGDMTELERALGVANAGKPTVHNIPGLKTREVKEEKK